MIGDQSVPNQTKSRTVNVLGNSGFQNPRDNQVGKKRRPDKHIHVEEDSLVKTIMDKIEEEVQIRLQKSENGPVSSSSFEPKAVVPVKENSSSEKKKPVDKDLKKLEERFSEETLNKPTAGDFFIVKINWEE